MCRLLLLVLCAAAIPAAAQPLPGVKKFFSARWYDRYQGAARTALVQQLQDRDWQAIDSMYGLPEPDGIRRMSTSPVDLAPYVNDDGYIVYWVPEVAPLFPGGEKALQQFTRDVVYPHLPSANNEMMNSVYIRCIVTDEGQVTDVSEAMPGRDWIPREIVDSCLDAVRYMPTWKPGLFHGKPVRAWRLIVFAIGG